MNAATQTTTAPLTMAIQDLVVRAKDGDRQAFNDLVIQHRESVVNVVYRMCGDGNIAEDAAQEAFIRAWNKLHTYHPRAPFRNWLFRIAVNAARDTIRQERPTVDIADLPLTDNRNSNEGAILAQERSAQIRAAVLALPENSRVVLVMREYEDCSYREIAETLDIPIGTVMSRLNYARSKLRESLKAYLEV